MKLFKKTITALVMSASLLGVACNTEPAPESTQNQTESAVEQGLMPAAPEAPGKFDIQHLADGQWQFRLIGDHGDIVMSSEKYVAKESAYNGILSIEENGISIDNYLVSDDNGAWNFALRAKNYEVIGHSPRFGTQAEAEEAAEVARELVVGLVQYKAAMIDGARFDLWRDTDSREWFFVLRAEDGRILLESEGYQGRTGAVNGIDSVRENARIDNRYKTETTDEGVFLILRAGNWQEIGRTGPFDTEADAAGAQAEITELVKSEKVANPW